MNNRFKFRIFIKNESNPKYNEMFKVHSLHFGTNKAIISSQHGNVSVKLDSNKILMQSTGLKDKNGKQIYEGDIVKDDKDLMYVVEFHEHQYATSFSLKRIEIPNYYPHITTYCGLGYKNRNNYEVTGNIYENKELLDEQKE